MKSHDAYSVNSTLFYAKTRAFVSVKWEDDEKIRSRRYNRAFVAISNFYERDARNVELLVLG